MKKVILMITALVINWYLSAQDVEWAESMGGTAIDQGQAIATDDFGIGKSQGELFVALTYYPYAHFQTAYPDGTVFNNPFAINGSSDFGNIGILSIDGPDSPTFGHVNAVNDKLDGYAGQALYSDYNIEEDISEIFICGTSDLNEDYIPSVAYAKLSYNEGTASLSNEWERSSADQRLNFVANDLTGKINGDQIVLVGTFSKELSLLSSADVSETVASDGFTDAFYTIVNKSDGYITTDHTIHTFDIGRDEMAEATSVTGDGSYFYVGGNYMGEADEVFQAELTVNSLDQSAFINGYIYSFELATNTSKIENIWNEKSNIDLTGLDDNSINLIFFGNYLLGSPFTSFGGIDAYNYSEMGQKNLFMGQIDMMGTDWDLPVLTNSTINYRSGSHHSTRTSIGRKGYAFYTGSYSGDMSYFLGTPASGDLAATGTSTSVYNAFYLRQSILTNQLRSPIILAEDAADESDIATIAVYPNPTDGQIRINLADYDSDEVVTVKLYSELGAVIYIGQFNAASVELDLSQFENGIYMLQTNLNGTSKMTRIVKL